MSRCMYHAAILILAELILLGSPQFCIAQSEFLRYRQSSLGLEVAYAIGDETEKAHAIAVTVSLQGTLDVSGSIGLAWLESGLSEGYDAKTYSLAAMLHPWKTKRDAVFQARFGLEYSSVKSRGLPQFIGYADDDSRTTLGAEGSIYVVPAGRDILSLSPMVTVGHAFMSSGEEVTYYAVQMSAVARRRNGLAFVRVGVAAERKETLLVASIGALGSVGHKWE